MARYLLSLLVSTWATDASVLNATAPLALRNEVCRYCHKLCPISCFVGTCSLHSGYTTRKFETTNQCYSCDPAVSVGINKDGDFMRCEASESGVSLSGTSPFTQQQGIKQGPQGPAVPGNAGIAALKAQQQAQKAVAAASKAAIWAEKAAQAATAKYRSVTGSSADGEAAQAFSSEAQAENHEKAAQIRAEEALRVAEAAHVAWKAAMDVYNGEIAKLRRQQLITDQSEKQLAAAEKASEKARGEYASMQAVATAAMEAVMKSGGSAASKITSQAAAEELAGAAMAAHRRLVSAAKEAKDASEKIAIASSMAPCVAGMFLQTDRAFGAPPIIGCISIKEKAEQDMRLTPILREVKPVLPAFGAPPGLNAEEHVDGLGDLDTEPAVPAEGQLEIPSLSQQMSDQLAEKLESNPAAVEDASLFSVPQVPFTAEQTPVDGMEQPASFDLSTISTLQTRQRPMLRKASLHA